MSLEIRQPSVTTLEKYGLVLEEWKTIWESQGKKCPVCEKEPKTQSPTEFMIDHAHVKGWKNMSPEQRKKYVRGILCYFCNRFYLAKAISIQKAKNIIKYLSNQAK